MPHDPATTRLYHITNVGNLPSIITNGGLLSDVRLGRVPHQDIGYGHIKMRRMTQNRVSCCNGRFVGEFVPFYFCPRSPMLFTVNKGATGLPPGCQTDIVHLVTTVAAVVALGRQFAISDGNAGSGYATYHSDLAALDEHLNWDAIDAWYWSQVTHFKSAEFLVADRVEFTAIQAIGCQNAATAAQVAQHLRASAHKPTVTVEPTWYY